MSEHNDNSQHMLPTGEPGAPEPGAGPAEDVLNVISQVEAQLEGLKKVHIERRKSERDLLARQEALSQREEELRAQFDLLARDLSVVEEERRRVEEQRRGVDEAAGQIQARRSEIEQIERDLERRGDEVAQQIKALEAARADASERSGKLELRAQQLEQAEARLAAQAEQLSERISELERSAREATEQWEGEARRAEQAERARAEADSAVLELRAELERVQGQAGRLGEGMQARDAEVSALEARAEDLARQTQSLRELLEQRERMLETAEEQRAELERQAAERIGALAEKLVQIEAAGAQAEAAADAQRRRIAELESQSAGLQSRIEQMHKAGAGGDDSLRRQTAALLARIEEQDREISGRDQVIADLHAKLKAAAENLPEVTGVLGSREVNDPRAAEALHKAISLNDQLQAKVHEQQAVLARLEKENRALREQTGKASRRIAAPDERDEFITLRRERLSRLRLALREQTRKVRRANALLQERFDQCERLLSRRAELAAAHQALQQQRERAGRAQARSATAGVMLAFAATLAVLLGLSWVLAEKISPGEYAASAAMEADITERALNEQELSEWQTYHEQLLEDPRFMETAADLLKRRGITTLATPGALDAYLDTSLTMESPADGKLNLELRGQGSTRTERVLDTLVVAMARAGNRTRGRRLDGATTVVVEPAAARRDPLDQTRLTCAGAIFGGGFLLTSGLGLVVWKRMAAAKSKFEHDQQLEALLAEARWTDPRINLDAPGAAAGSENGAGEQ
ncbi:MAG: hypothetical protein DYG94_03700 [Leptolyngbya sp. PLA3]|nr:MAG: hypothetical protein EDM82_08840 [Cyanobacteria bacterium CYA]MCE7967833.1 hypothetical protein [Leptolyngbya sp. PL-A3]